MQALLVLQPLRTLIGRALIVGFALTSSTLQAQTFAGRDSLTSSPVSFRAVVFPGHASVLKIALEKYSSRPVEIKFLDAQRQTLHREYVWDRAYYRRFNVEQLPGGKYTVVISIGRERYTQLFQIRWHRAEQDLVISPPKVADHLLANH